MRKRKCNKFKKFILNRPQNLWPAKVKKHFNECIDCRKNYEWDVKLKSISTAIPKIPLQLDEDRDFAVRSAIVSASQRIQAKEKKSLLPLPLLKPLGVLLSFMIIGLGWLSWPLVNNLPLWDHRAEQRLALLLEEDPVSIVMTETLKDDRLDTLRFMGKVLDTPDSQKLFLTTSSHQVNRSQWIWLIFLSETANQTPQKIKNLLIQHGNIGALRKLNLPVWDTLRSFEEYFGPFQKISEDETFWVDAHIVAVQWQERTILTDALEQPLHMDPLLINQIYPGQQQRIQIKETEGIFYVTALEELMVNLLTIQGHLTQVDSHSLRVSGYSSPIHLTENTQFVFVDHYQLKSSKDEVYTIRAIVMDDKFYAVSVVRNGSMTPRTLTSTLSYRFAYGFVLDDYPLNCYFAQMPQLTPDTWSFTEILQKRLPVTVEGKQWKDQFLVTHIHVLENPLDPIPREEFYYAGTRVSPPPAPPSPPLPPDESKGPVTMVLEDDSDIQYIHQTDFVAGISGSTLHLVSGRDVTLQDQIVTPGSRIDWKDKKGEIPKDLTINPGSEGKIKSSYRLVKKHDNQVHLLQVEHIAQPVFIFSRDKIPEQGIIQAHTMRHDQAIIAIESRCFTISEIATFKGTIVKTMHQNTWFLMDNNMIFMVDALTQIEGGPILPGSTVVVKGKLTDQSFRAYIVEVANEMLVFTGIIVAMDDEQNMMQLDSGVKFYLDDDLFERISNKNLGKGSAVIVKAWLEGNKYRAEDIYDARDYVSDKGVVS